MPTTRDGCCYLAVQGKRVKILGQTRNALDSPNLLLTPMYAPTRVHRSAWTMAIEQTRQVVVAVAQTRYVRQ